MPRESNQSGTVGTPYTTTTYYVGTISLVVYSTPFSTIGLPHCALCQGSVLAPNTQRAVTVALYAPVYAR